MSPGILSDQRKITSHREIARINEPSSFVSLRARMSRDFDSRKDSQSTKFKQRPQIFLKVGFRELCNSKLSGLHAFDNRAIRHETPILEVIFVTLTKTSTVITNDTKGPQKYPHHWK